MINFYHNNCGQGSCEDEVLISFSKFLRWWNAFVDLKIFKKIVPKLYQRTVKTDKGQVGTTRHLFWLIERSVVILRGDFFSAHAF